MSHLVKNPFQTIKFYIGYDDGVYATIQSFGRRAALTVEQTMQLYTDQTVGDFKRKFQDTNKLQSCYINVLRNGVVLNDSQPVGDFIFADGMVNVDVALKVFQIFVVTLTGKSITIDVDAADTIAGIKDKISRKENIPSSDLRITYQSRTLDDTTPIHRYKIVHESNLRMALLLRGGGTASFMMREPTSEGFRIFDKSEMGESSNLINRGLNLLTKCRNESCSYYNQEIWISSGMNAEEPFELRVEANKTCCPNCHELTDTASNLGFYDCSFTYNGKYRDGERLKEALGKYSTPSKKFAILSEEVQLRDWSTFSISVTPRKSWFSCLSGRCCCCC